MQTSHLLFGLLVILLAVAILIMIRKPVEPFESGSFTDEKEYKQHSHSQSQELCLKMKILREQVDRCKAALSVMSAVKWYPCSGVFGCGTQEVSR